MRYIATETDLRKSLHMQVMSRCKPESITYPKGWVPFTSLDKLVARNLIIDMPISKILKIFPNFTVGFVNKCLTT